MHVGKLVLYCMGLVIFGSAFWSMVEEHIPRDSGQLYLSRAMTRSRAEITTAPDYKHRSKVETYKRVVHEDLTLMTMTTDVLESSSEPQDRSKQTPLQRRLHNPEEMQQYRARMKKVYAYSDMLTERMHQYALSNLGDRTRLRNALTKLVEGEPLRLAVVGGSVTAGAGAARFEESYGGRIFNWIKTSFPHKGHTLHNGAHSAASSGYVAQCLSDYIPDGIDVVIIDFTFNDYSSEEPPGLRADNDSRRGFEILLRKLLSYQSQPAVIILHWWTPHVIPEFWRSAEDEMDVIAKYYHVPTLSWRNAFHDLIRSNISGFRQDEIYSDKVHPSPLGHRYLGDIIIGYLQSEAAMVVQVDGKFPVDPAFSLLPAGLPEPLLPGNNEGVSKCTKNEDFRKQVTAHEGWKWVDEGKRGRPKWGFVSTTPGKSLTIGPVDSKTSFYGEKVLIGLGILKSYHSMGMAKLECVSGCECDEVKIDALHKERNSIVSWFYHPVTQHNRCVMKVTVLKDSNSWGHKFKVQSLMVTNMHGTYMGHFSYVEKQTQKDRQQA